MLLGTCKGQTSKLPSQLVSSGCSALGTVSLKARATVAGTGTLGHTGYCKHIYRKTCFTSSWKWLFLSLGALKICLTTMWCKNGKVEFKYHSIKRVVLFVSARLTHTQPCGMASFVRVIWKTIKNLCLKINQPTAFEGKLKQKMQKEKTKGFAGVIVSLNKKTTSACGWKWKTTASLQHT